MELESRILPSIRQRQRAEFPLDLEVVARVDDSTASQGLVIEAEWITVCSFNCCKGVEVDWRLGSSIQAKRQRLPRQRIRVVVHLDDIFRVSKALGFRQGARYLCPACCQCVLLQVP